MDVEEFVTGVLQQVKGAVAKASDKRSSFYIDNKGVHFDLAVTNTSTLEKDSGGKGKLAIKVVEAEYGKGGKSTIGQEAVSRIEFSVGETVNDDGYESGIVTAHTPRRSIMDTEF